ncbi:unnamed protein product [Moneuplotes crassus]|uniref:Penicillin amidase n=1 Tax=Euplotes crassus TaxID=5936 RepID=A0AAD1Y3P5_EUPCR|nr:unnamed protein product [Moneuplotes crassus]
MKRFEWCCLFVSAIVIVVGFYLGTFVPSFTRQMTLKHHTGTAEIFFEDNGLPHIKVDANATAGYALGYLHARDRLWQMDYLRRLAQGRLSEVLGSKTIKLDEAMKVIQTTKTCKHIVTQFENKDAKLYIEAYVDGINDYVKENSLPIQYKILWSEFDEWTMIDTCAAFQFIRFSLTHNWGLEVARDFVKATTDNEELMHSMFAFDHQYFDEFMHTIVEDSDLRELNMFSQAATHEVVENPRVSNISHYFKSEVEKAFDMIQEIDIEGSNSWVISGNLTKSGEAILANDPHLTNQAPSTWYPCHIMFPDGTDLFGAAIPTFGVPVIIATDKIATGMTSIFADASDVYQEIIEDDKYLYKGVFYPLEHEEHIIKVKGEPDHKAVLKYTRNGPLIDQYYHIFGHIDTHCFKFEINQHLSMKWIGADPYEFNAMDIIYEVMFAEDVYEVKDLLINLTGFQQNCVFADSQGNIGFVPIGSFPKRNYKNQGATISQGWTGENDWIGYLSPEEKPYLINPPRGFIVAANNGVTSLNTEHPLAGYVPGNPRASRINDLLTKLIQEKTGKIEYKDMINILEDTLDNAVKHKKVELIQAVHNHFKVHTHLNVLRTQQVLSQLAKWDGSFDADLEAPTYFSMWEYYLISNILSDQFKDQDLKMELLSHPFTEKFLLRFYRGVNREDNYKPEYCTSFDNQMIEKFRKIDGKDTTEVDSCAELVTLALEKAINYLDKEKEKRSIKWGDFHPYFYVSLPFSMTPLASWFERYTPGGGNINTIKYSLSRYELFDGTLKSISSANYKVIIEFGGDYHYSIDTGFSENPLSSQYFDWNPRHMKSDLATLVKGEELKILRKEILMTDDL